MINATSLLLLSDDVLPQLQLDYMIMNAQIVQTAGSKGGISETGFSILGYDFNFYGLFILCLLGFFIFLLWRAQRNHRLDWVDIITVPQTNQISLTKVLQLIGGAVGTWVVVQLTLQGKMTWEIFAIYLAYVASIEGFSKFIRAKYGVFVEPRTKGGGVPASKTNATVED